MAGNIDEKPINLGGLRQFKKNMDNSAQVFSNPNLLINPDFSINQRGQTEYDSSGMWMYSVDRWRCNGIVTIADGGINLTGLLVYSFESQMDTFLTGKTVTLSLCVNSSIYTFTFVYGTAVYSNFPCGIQFEHPMAGHGFGNLIGFTNVTTKPIALTWVKLELGSIATPFVPPNPATELAKCQRYYQIRSTGDIPAVDLRPSMREITDIKQREDGNYEYIAEL